MRILAIDSAIGRCSATLVEGNLCMAGLQHAPERDHAAVLPVMVRDVLRQGGMTPAKLDLIAVTVGPGSFTGIRSGLALAQGLGLASGRPVVGVTVGEALVEPLLAQSGRALWWAISSRRGRVFIGFDHQILSLAITDLPVPHEPIALAGPAGQDVAARLAGQGADVILTDSILPTGMAIAKVGRRRLLGELAPMVAEPLYVDAPEARPRAATEAMAGPDADSSRHDG